jgi:arylsulfatase A-like enzyme/Flp pilus assembly protein TadD
MSRWLRISALLLLVILSMSSAAAGQGKQSRTAAKPNVLLITIDTLRADRLGCYGYKRISTPNIDALCGEGIRFERAYAPVPTTLPSHSTILTGTYPMLHGMHDFSGNRLSPQQPTLATILKAHGYVTGAVIGAAVLDSRFGLDNGFDYYYDDFDFSRIAETNLDAMERPGNVVVDKALDWLGKNAAKPFLLWVHIYDPHHPYTPPEPYAGRYKQSPYDGEVAFADAQVGRVLQFLKTKRLYADTVIALAGDHGEGLGEHGEKTHGLLIYNTTMHVPLIIRPNGTAARGNRLRTVATPVSLVDLLPTVLDAVKIAPMPPIQGKSLLPLLDPKRDAAATSVYSETYLPRIHFNWSELRGLHQDRYHFIDGPKPELYDLLSDPGEKNNLYASKPALAEELRGSLAKTIREHTPAAELAEKTSLDPAMAERLKALGYAAVSAGSTPTLSDKNLPDPKDRIGTYELISSAIEDSQRGRYDESIGKLTEAAKTETESVPVHYLLALNYYRKRDFAAAQREFTRVLEWSPEYSLAAYYLGLAYVGSKEWDPAIAWFQRALALDATNHAAAYNLGVTYVQKRMFPEAITSLQNAIRIYPGYVQAYRSLADLYLFQQNPDAAVEFLREAARIEPRDARTFVALARAYQAKGMTAEAEQAQRTAQQLQGAQPN